MKCITKRFNRLWKDKYFLIANLLAFVYFILLATITIMRHDRFLTTASDLGIFDQAFWTTVFEGEFFYETPDMWFNPKGSFFGVHFSPILLVFLPLYAIYPSPKTLLIIQAFFIAVATIPIYLLAREKFGNYALLISCLYIIYTPMLFVSLFDFHLEALVPAPLLFAVYYFDKKDYKKFFVFLVLSLSTIEFVPIIALFFAIYVLIREFMFLLKRREKVRYFIKETDVKYAVLTAIISIIWLFIALKTKEIFNPHASPMPSQFRHILNVSRWGYLLEYLQKYLDDKTFYIILLLGPLSFLSVLSPLEFLPALPWLLLCFFSDYKPYFLIQYQYSAFVVAFIFYSFIKSLEKLTVAGKSPNKGLLRKLIALAVISSLIFTVFTVEEYKVRRKIFGTYDEDHIKLLNKIISLIPRNASVLTQNDIFPHVSQRKHVYLYLPRADFEPDFILIDIKLEFYRSPPPYPPYSAFIPQYLKTHPNYGIYASADGIILFKKDYLETPVFFIPYIRLLNYKDLILGKGRIIHDASSKSKYVYFHSRNMERGTFWFGPYEIFPSGEYKAIFCLKVKETVNDTVIIIDISADHGVTILASKVIKGVDFNAPNTWQNFTLEFEIYAPMELEFRGIFVSNATDVYLDYILVKQMPFS